MHTSFNCLNFSTDSKVRRTLDKTTFLQLRLCGVNRPKIEEKNSFELKGQFLKELQENTFSGSDNEDSNEHIEKVLEIVDLFHVPNITVDQLMLRVFPISLTGAASRWLRNEPTGEIVFYMGWTFQLVNSDQRCHTIEDCAVAMSSHPRNSQNLSKWHNDSSRGSIVLRLLKDCAYKPLNNLGREIKKVNEKVYAAQVGSYYTQFGGPFQRGGYRATALGYYQRNNANPLYQERRQSMEDTLSKFMSESAKRLEENSNLIKEIRATTDAAIRNQGASIKTLEIQIGQMS
ncbi:hypothetical protein Tco_1234319 [Tanacetum coccineum]